MSIKSSLRKWIFPSKTDSFEISYDHLSEFFTTLDEEFGSTLDFLNDYKITKFFRTQLEIDNSLDFEIGDNALYIKTGDILQFNGSHWDVVDRVGKLSKLKERDPNQSDIGHEKGASWVNKNSGETFRFIGEVVIDVNTNSKEAIWVNQESYVKHSSSVVKEFTFYPLVNFTYRTKKLSNVLGTLTFDDNLLHLEGVISKDGLVQHLNYDTHVDIFIQDFLVGTLEINGENTQTLMDLEYFNPEGGLPDASNVEINHWYARFERLLLLLEVCSHTKYDLEKALKTDLVFNENITNILELKTTFEDFFSDNGLTLVEEEMMFEIKEKYRSFFSSLHDTEMTIPRKIWSLYLLGQCNLIESYDGNIYYLDGSIMEVDGNNVPIC